MVFSFSKTKRHMKTNLIKLSCGLVPALLLAQSQTVLAQTSFQTLDLTPYGNYTLNQSGPGAAGFPLDNPTYLGHVPFIQDNGANEVWNSYFNWNGSSASLNIALDIPNAYGAYTLLNTWWGQDASQGSVLSVSFGFSDSSSVTFNLLGNMDVRDYNNPGSGYTTTINGTTTQNVYVNSGGNYLLDRQWFDFSADAGKTLTSMSILDTGGPNIQDALLSGATIQAGAGGQVTGPVLNPGDSWTPTPEPTTLAMSVMGRLGMWWQLRRRK